MNDEKDTSQVLAIAQIGCGYWGPNLLRNLISLPGCHVALLAEASVERRQYVQATYPQVSVAADFETALQDTKIDALVIATPARSHYPLARRALLAGKHIFVEKPLAMTVAEVDDLATLAAQRRCVVMVGHTFLYNSAVRHLRELVRSGELGQIYYIYSQRLNLGVLRSDINVMWNLAPHDVSILCYLLDGSPVEINAVGTAFIQRDIEDVVFMDLVWPGGVRGNVHVSWLDPNKTRSVTVVGSKKMVTYDDTAKDKITVFDKGIDLVPGDRQGMPFDYQPFHRVVHRTGAMTKPVLDYPEPLQVELSHFLECVRSGAEPLTGVTHAREVVRILEAAQQSLDRHRTKS